jgi:hypothetical protein
MCCGITKAASVIGVVREIQVAGVETRDRAFTLIREFLNTTVMTIIMIHKDVVNNEEITIDMMINLRSKYSGS